MDGFRSKTQNRGTTIVGFHTILLLLISCLPLASSLGSMSGLAAISSSSEVRIRLGEASFVGVSGGRNFFCGLRRWSMQPFCWDSSNSTVPRRLSQNSYTEISVGDSHVCGIRASDSGVDCWRTQTTELQAPPAANLQSITSGSNFSCGIQSANSTVICWGQETIQQQFQPVQSSPFRMIAAGSNHVCGLYSAFRAKTYCWGDNSFNQINHPNGTEFAAFALGQQHSCGLSRETRYVICWGDNSTSQLSAPINTTFDSITAGDFFTCGVRSDDLAVLCWGGQFRSGGVLQSLPGTCTSSSLNQHVCVFCTKCADQATETAPCVNRNRQCSPSAAPAPPPQIITRPKSRKKLTNVEIVSIVLGSTGMLLGIAAVVACSWRKIVKRESDTRIHHSPNANNGSVTISQQQQLRRQRSGASTTTGRSYSRGSLGRADSFTLAELELATDNFSEENRIGNGSFGSVYRGVLPDGREVAIKRGGIGSSILDTAAKKRFQDKEAAFQSELDFLTRLHHRHLVTLVGFCAEDDERLLVYDFMPNGTVHDHLHGSKEQEELPGTLKNRSLNRRNLNSWQMRIGIALQAARGIEYLHTYAVPPIIHRDIKSSNILLDSDFSARVSDFGLSLMGPSDDESHLSMTAAGTVGYMDPEYYRLQHLTTKSDVYSFGVVLLELLTGKRAIIVENKMKLQENRQLPVNVVDYAVPFIVEGQIASILDPRITVFPQQEMQAISIVAELAEQCVRLEGKERPTMGEIVSRLEIAVTLLNHSSDLERRNSKKKMKLFQQLSRSRSNTDSSGEIRELQAPRD